MLTLLKRLINTDGTQQQSMPPEEKTRLAACVLLLEAAHVDNECSEEELDHVIATLKKDFSLARPDVEELVELAHCERDAAIDLWQFTNHINQHYSKEEKNAVMESVWRIIFADGRLDAHEDHFAHKLAKLLRLSHREMIDAKLRVREESF